MSIRWLLWPYGLAAVLLAVVAAGAAATGTPPSQFTRDPAVLLNASPLLGLISYAGVLVWTATAVVALFTAALLRRRSDERTRWTFLTAAGLLTLWLMLDDLFLFHEWLFPEVLGIRTRIVFAAYIILCGAFLFRFSRLIMRRTNYLALAVALMFLAASVAVDVLPEAWFRWDYLFFIEDGAKLLGIAGWFAYFTGVSADFLLNPEKT
jgi:hypothetical protein